MADAKDLQAESIPADTELDETPEEIESLPGASKRVYTFWQAADRDSVAGSAIDADFQFLVTDSSNEILSALLQMDGLNGYDEKEVLQKTGRKISRPRRLGKFFERMGIMYRDGQTTRLTELGKRLA